MMDCFLLGLDWEFIVLLWQKLRTFLWSWGFCMNILLVGAERRRKWGEFRLWMLGLEFTLLKALCMRWGKEFWMWGWSRLVD